MTELDESYFFPEKVKITDKKMNPKTNTMEFAHAVADRPAVVKHIQGLGFEQVSEPSKLGSDVVVKYHNKNSNMDAVYQHNEKTGKANLTIKKRKDLSFKEHFLASKKLELEEGALMVSAAPAYDLHKKGPQSHPIIKNHGVAPDGSSVYSVKQPNGFHGVLAVKDGTVIGSSSNNLSKSDAINLGSHYVKHGATGIGVGKNWSLGSGIYGKVTKENTNSVI